MAGVQRGSVWLTMRASMFSRTSASGVATCTLFRIRSIETVGTSSLTYGLRLIAGVLLDLSHQCRVVSPDQTLRTPECFDLGDVGADDDGLVIVRVADHHATKETVRLVRIPLSGNALRSPAFEVA